MGDSAFYCELLEYVNVKISIFPAVWALRGMCTHVRGDSSV
jgi:hypothetical protein